MPVLAVVQQGPPQARAPQIDFTGTIDTNINTNAIAVTQMREGSFAAEKGETAKIFPSTPSSDYISYAGVPFSLSDFRRVEHALVCRTITQDLCRLRPELAVPGESFHIAENLLSGESNQKKVLQALMFVAKIRDVANTRGGAQVSQHRRVLAQQTYKMLVQELSFVMFEDQKHQHSNNKVPSLELSNISSNYDTSSFTSQSSRSSVSSKTSSSTHSSENSSNEEEVDISDIENLPEFKNLKKLISEINAKYTFAKREGDDEVDKDPNDPSPDIRAFLKQDNELKKRSNIDIMQQTMQFVCDFLSKRLDLSNDEKNMPTIKKEPMVEVKKEET